MKRKLICTLLCVSMVAAMLLGCESKNKTDDTTKKNDSASKKEVEVKNEGDPIVLASMSDEESQIFGEMMKQMLEANGYEVESSGVGTYNNTTLPRQSLMEGQIDVTMDYTGRGMMFIDGVDESLYQSDLETAFNTTKEADEKNGIEWLCYSPYSNTDGLCVKKDWAEKNNITSGIGNNLFAPEDYLTREMSMTFLYRALKHLDIVTQMLNYYFLNKIQLD